MGYNMESAGCNCILRGEELKVFSKCKAVGSIEMEGKGTEQEGGPANWQCLFSEASSLSQKWFWLYRCLGFVEVLAYLRIIHPFFWESFHWPCLWCYCFRGLRETIQWLASASRPITQIFFPLNLKHKDWRIRVTTKEFHRHPIYFDNWGTKSLAFSYWSLSTSRSCNRLLLFLVCFLLLIIGIVLRSFCFCLWDRVSVGLEFGM